MVTLWGREWTRPELLARVGRLEQIAGIRLVEGGDGAERGVRLLRCWSGAGFDFEILVDRGFDIGGAWIGGHMMLYHLVGAAVVNRAIGLGVFQRYERSALPRHITWRQLGTVAYVVAMEPSTNRARSTRRRADPRRGRGRGLGSRRHRERQRHFRPGRPGEEPRPADP